jgi:hypothetical protein
MKLLLAHNPSRVDISSKEVRPFIGRIVLLLLGILLCFDAIVITVRVTILVVRIILISLSSAGAVSMTLSACSNMCNSKVRLLVLHSTC